jgi:hypothetical protein
MVVTLNASRFWFIKISFWLDAMTFSAQYPTAARVKKKTEPGTAKVIEKKPSMIGLNPSQRPLYTKCA